MIRSVVVWLPSGNDVRIRPMLAQVLLPGLANESLISNSNVAIGAIACSQNAEMPSWPWWPCPSRVEHRRADRVLEDRVLGVHRQPLGEVALGHRGVGALDAARAGWSSSGAFQVMASEVIAEVLMPGIVGRNWNTF